jgi:hypothetical protein
VTQTRLLQESAAVATPLRESTELREAMQATATGGARRYRARLIEGDRWGSSGYYSREMLERDGPNVFTEGTQIYFDHPGEQERYDRPERSVRDLAGKIVSTPVYEGDGLYSDVEFFPHVAPVIEGMWADIGMSIRANGTSEQGEAAGRSGQIITGLTEAFSVDLVTKAGAGGRIVSLLESARPDRVAERAVESGVEEATANELRDGLDQLVKDRYGSDDKYVWVRDFDASTVWFEDGDGLWQQSYAGNTLTGTRIEVRSVTTYVPVNPAGLPNPTESKEDTKMPEIEESELSQLRADAGRVQALESERAAAVAELATARARETARPIVAAIVAESTVLVGARTQSRVTESVLASVPMTEDGQLDEAQLRTVAEAARTAAEEEVNEYATSVTTAPGTIRGFGEAAPPAKPEDTEIHERAEAARARAFGRPLAEQKGA